MTLSPAIGCTRLSNQSQTNGYGADVQARDIRQFAQAHGLTIGEIIDEVRSGATDLADRNVLQDYYARAKATPGQAFIFPRVDRLGRLAELIIGIARQLIRHGAQVWVVGFDKPLDPKAPDWLMLQFKAMMAEQDYLGIMQRTMSGKIAKAQRGGWPSGRVPWGYRMTRDERGKALLPEPHPERAPAVRRIFELRATLGCHETAQVTNREGWPTISSTARWTRDSVLQLTNNSAYVGDYRFGAITIPIPPLVTPEAFEAVQQNKRERTVHRGPRGDHLLSGVAYCASYGAAMTRTTGAVRNSKDTWYYRCWRAMRERGKCGVRTYFRQDQLEPMVWAAFIATATDPEKLAQLLEQVQASAPDPSRQAQHAELDAAIARAWEPYTRGIPGVTFEMAQEAARPYVVQKAQLGRHEAVGVSMVDVVRVAAHLAEVLFQPMTSAGQRSWLQAMHVKAYVGSGAVQRLTMDIPKV